MAYACGTSIAAQTRLSWRATTDPGCCQLPTVAGPRCLQPLTLATLTSSSSPSLRNNQLQSFTRREKYQRQSWNLNSLERPRVVVRAAQKDTVVPDPDPRIPLVLLGTSAALLAADNKLAAAPVGLLGALLLFQTTRVRFVFGPEALEVRIGKQLDESGENVFVGGENKWRYDTFTNWEFWWPQFPVLVYFKETQTKPEGQIHFFPIILNGKQLYDVMKERCGPSKNSA